MSSYFPELMFVVQTETVLTEYELSSRVSFQVHSSFVPFISCNVGVRKDNYIVSARGGITSGRELPTEKRFQDGVRR